MKNLLRFATFLSSFFILAILNQCTVKDKQVVPTTILSARSLAADSSFVRVVTVSNDFQTVIYNQLRDVVGRTARKKVNSRTEHLLSANQPDSLLLAIKLLGFENQASCLLGLDKIERAAKQLTARGWR